MALCTLCDAGVTYLDDYVSPSVLSAYVGIIYAMAVLGPAVGFILGGLILRLYTDFDRVNDGESVRQSPCVRGVSVSGCQSPCVRVSVCQGVSHHVSGCQCVRVSVCQCVSVSVHQCVSASVTVCQGVNVSVTVCQGD